MNPSARILDPDDIEDEKLRRLYALWCSRRGLAGRLPSIGDFDPLEFYFAWGNVSLVDVIRSDEPRFFFRLDGTRVAARTGDWTGKHLYEIEMPEYVPLVRDGYYRNILERTALRHRRDMQCDGIPMKYELVSMPVQDSSGHVVRLLLGFAPEGDWGPANEPRSSFDLFRN